MGVESVLLYYKYTDLKEQQEDLRRWYLTLCEKLSLVGRVRVAEDGVNVTVGGRHTALLEHISAVEQHPSLGKDIDFKLARSSGPLNDTAVRESGFNGLQVSLCKEVVSLGGVPQCPPDELPLKTARHLTPAEWHSFLQDKSASSADTVLLDTRNVYETRIGHFSAEGAELVDPKLRQFGDLPAWLEANAGQLRDRRVLMYCTGGVRCERASALLKDMGPAFSNVYQLQGGIQRYLEQFPDGGFFRGKNFVFDERVAVGPENGRDAPAVGTCLVCSTACDDYGPRRRCQSCRLLVLICSACAQETKRAICELCRAKSEAPQLPPPRKLRILCLHGFRQTGRSLERHMARFRQAVGDLVELSFADAPHALPFLYRPAADPEKAKPLPEIDPSRPRRAWLVEPSQLLENARSQEPGWVAIDESSDRQQYRQQTEGWGASSSFLRSFIAEHGPFDGCLGFSQGAAAATALCAECQEEGLNSRQLSHEEGPHGKTPFRFVILCSGYASYSRRHRMTQQRIGRLQLPSLHVIGADGQVASEDCRALCECYCEEGRTVLEHRGGGHSIPLDKRYLSLIRKFLEGML